MVLMVGWFAVALVFGAAPYSETALEKGFADVAYVGDVALIASADGSVRSLSGNSAVDTVFKTGRKMVGIAVSADSRRVAVVGAGVVARSDDGGHIFRVEPLPDDAMAYAAAFVGDTLLVFDKDGRGFRSTRSGQFEPLRLPAKTRYWSASFEGATGFVVGENGVLIGTVDGGQTWMLLRSPDAEPQGVALFRGALYVSGEKGVFRSTDGAVTFHNVLTLPGKRSDCIRMSRSADTLAVACAPLGHTLFRSRDGVEFEEIAAPQAANMVGVAVSARGELVAVGSYELILRTKGLSGTLLFHSEQTRVWAQVLRRLQAEKLSKKASLADAKARKPSKDARTIRGTLLTEDGRPVPDIPVRSNDGASAMTDRDGRFQLPPSSDFVVQLAVDVDTFAPLRRSVTVDAFEPATVDLVLRKAVPLSGRLFAPDPAMQVTAALRLLSAPPADQERARYAERAHPVATAQANADGRFNFVGVAPGEYLLDVRPSGFPPFTTLVRAPDEGLSLKLLPGAKVTGRFLDAEGKPVTDSNILLRGEGLRSAARVDSAGQFELTGLPDGDYVLEATAVQKRICLRREIEVTGGVATDLVVRLGRGPNITGRILDERGAPVPSALVMGTTTADALCGARIAEADLGGEFVLEDVADGVYSVAAVIIGGKVKSGRAFAEKDAKPGERIEIRLVR